MTIPSTSKTRRDVAGWLATCCCLALTIVGCAPSVKPRSTLEAALATTRELVSEYGKVNASECNAFFSGVTRRLLPDQVSGFDFIVLNTAEPIAVSPGARKIVLSRGLIRLLSSEDEAAFLVTHEAGHYVLDHHRLAREASDDGSVEDRKDLELEADRFALSRLIAHGYDATAAVTALSAVYRSIQDRGKASEYPTLSERIQALSMQVLQARPFGYPGTGGRTFAMCRVQLG